MKIHGQIHIGMLHGSNLICIEWSFLRERSYYSFYFHFFRLINHDGSFVLQRRRTTCHSIIKIAHLNVRIINRKAYEIFQIFLLFRSKRQGFIFSQFSLYNAKLILGLSRKSYHVFHYYIEWYHSFWLYKREWDNTLSISVFRSNMIYLINRHI